jgi:hypothetical protein
MNPMHMSETKNTRKEIKDMTIKIATMLSDSNLDLTAQYNVSYVLHQSIIDIAEDQGIYFLVQTKKK